MQPGGAAAASEWKMGGGDCNGRQASQVLAMHSFGVGSIVKWFKERGAGAPCVGVEAESTCGAAQWYRLPGIEFKKEGVDGEGK